MLHMFVYFISEGSVLCDWIFQVSYSNFMLKKKKEKNHNEKEY